MSRTSDKYRKVETKIEQKNDDKEIRLKGDRQPGIYITRAAQLLLVDKLPYVILKGVGRAISKALLVAEIIRFRIKNLHQINSITQNEVTDVFEPTEEGLDKVVKTRVLAVFQVKLTLQPTEEDKKSNGYQPLIDQHLVQEMSFEQIQQHRKQSF